jgi:hypothetical protein
LVEQSSCCLTVWMFCLVLSFLIFS